MKQATLTDNDFVALSVDVRRVFTKVAAERRYAFLHGVDEFCKQAGFDEEDRSAMLCMLKSGWWGGQSSEDTDDTNSLDASAAGPVAGPTVSGGVTGAVGSMPSSGISTFNPLMGNGFYDTNLNADDPDWKSKFYDGYKKNFKYKIDHGDEPDEAARVMRMESGRGGIHKMLINDPEFASYFKGRQIGTPSSTGPSLASGSSMPPTAAKPAVVPPTLPSAPSTGAFGTAGSTGSSNASGPVIGSQSTTTLNPVDHARSAIQNASSAVPGAMPKKNPNAGIYVDQKGTDPSYMKNLQSSGGQVGERGKVKLPPVGF